MKHSPGFILFLVLIAGCTNNNNSTTATNESAGPSKANSIVAPAAKLVYEQKCGTCHGSDGTAGIANATNLQTSKADSLSVIQTISNGKNAMPSFKNQLAKEEIQKLLTYLYNLRKN
ncbi:MAG TPA: cytochrome c [Chitinophagaceae bacterium]|nr:cytochrome c [Chitinophagaceae bacterium]